MSEPVSVPAFADGVDASDIVRVNYARQKRQVMGLALAWAAISGVIAPFLFSEETIVELLLDVPYLVLVLKWCLIDAAQRGQQLGRVMRFALLLLMLFALAVYLLRSRGVAGILAVIQTLLFLALVIAINYAFQLATLHLGQAAGLWTLE